MADKRVNFSLLWRVDRQALNDSLASNERLNKKINEIRENAERLDKRMAELGRVTEASAALSAAAFAPLIAAANKYVQTIGEADTVSRAWLAQTERQQAAQLALGRKSAEALLPYREALIDILELASKVDPALIQAGVAGASVLAGVATIGLLVGQVAKLYTGIILLASNIRLLAASQGARNVAGFGGASIIGVGAGIEVSRAIGRAQGNEQVAASDLESLLKTIVDVFQLIVFSFMAVSKFVEEQFVEMKRRLQLAIASISETFESIGRTLESLLVGLQLAFVDLVGNNAASLLGLDANALRQRAGDLQGGGGNQTRQQLVNTIGFNRMNAVGQAGFDPRDIANQVDRGDTSGLEALVQAGILEQSEVNQFLSGLSASTKRRIDIEQQAVDSLEDIQKRYTLIANAGLIASDIIAQNYESTGTDAALPEPVMQLNQQLLDEYESFLEQQAALQTAFEERRAQNTAAHLKQLENLETRFRQQEQQIREQHLKSLSQLDTRYDKDNEQRRSEFNKSVDQLRDSAYKEDLQVQEKHNRDRQRLEESYQDRLRDAIGQRDGRALVNIYRERGRARQQSDEDFREQRRGRQSRLADELNALADSHKEQIALAKTNYDEQRQQLIANFNANNETRRQAYEQQVNEARVAYAQQQSDLQSSLRSETEARETAYRDRLVRLLQFQNEESGIRQQHYANLQNQLNQFLFGAQLAQIRSSAISAANSIAGAFGGGGFSSNSNSVGAVNVNINNQGNLNERQVGVVVRNELLNTMRSLGGRR